MALRLRKVRDGQLRLDRTIEVSVTDVKVKRRVIDEKYKDVIDRIYEEAVRAASR